MSEWMIAKRLICLAAALAYLAVLAGCANDTATIAAAWQSKPGLFSGRVNALLLTARVPDQAIYAAVEGGVYKSLDQGETWTPCLNGLSNRLVRALAMDPDRPNVLYAGTRGGRLYKTADGGDSWSDVSQGLAGNDIVAIAVDPERPDTVHVATTKRLYTSESGGSGWEVRSVMPGAPITSMALDSTNPAVIYVATQDGLLYYSTNRGINWNAPVQVTPGLSKVLAVPGRGGELYAIAAGQIYRGTTYGQTWTYNDNYLDDSEACCVAVNPREPQQVLVGGQSGVSRSNNGRASWIRSNQGLGASPSVVAVAYDPVQPANAYVALGSVIYRSEDGGATWARSGQIEERLGATILALLPHPQDPQSLLASAGGGGVFVSRDAGSSWQLLDGLPSAWVTDLGMSPLDPQLIYATTLQGVPYQSQDGGATWRSSTIGLRGVAITALAVDPEQPNQVYVGTWGDGMYQIQNWAQGWTKVALPAAYVSDLVMDTRTGRRLVYALTPDGVYRGDYRAEPNVPMFEPYLGSVAGLVPDVGGDARLLALSTAPGQGVEGAATSGEVRVLSAEGLGQGPPSFLVQNPVAPDQIYAAAPGMGVMRLDLDEERWQVVASGLADRQVLTLIVHPASLMLYAGTDQGVYALSVR